MSSTLCAPSKAYNQAHLDHLACIFEGFHISHNIPSSLCDSSPSPWLLHVQHFQYFLYYLSTSTKSLLLCQCKIWVMLNWVARLAHPCLTNLPAWAYTQVGTAGWFGKHSPFELTRCSGLVCASLSLIKMYAQPNYSHMQISRTLIWFLL